MRGRDKLIEDLDSALQLLTGYFSEMCCSCRIDGDLVGYDFAIFSWPQPEDDGPYHVFLGMLHTLEHGNGPSMS